MCNNSFVNYLANLHWRSLCTLVHHEKDQPGPCLKGALFFEDAVRSYTWETEPKLGDRERFPGKGGILAKLQRMNRI